MRSTLNEHRTVHAPFTVPDELLEFWGDIYCAAPQRMSFERFLADKLRTRRVGLLTAQQELRAATDEVYVLSNKLRLAVREAMRRSTRVVDNGHFTEKLRHRRWPRGRRDFIPQPTPITGGARATASAPTQKREKGS